MTAAGAHVAPQEPTLLPDLQAADQGIAGH